MKTFQTNIDKLVSKILNEEIDSKFEKKFNNKSENFEELIGNQSKIDVAEPKGKITAADFKKLRNSKYNKKEVDEYFDNEDILSSDIEEAETEEGNAFSGALAKAKKSGKGSFEVDGKKYNVKETIKTSLKLTEQELIDLIETIVLEQTVKDIKEKDIFKKNSPEGLKKTDKVLGLNKKENDDYAKEVVIKMKDYMKDMFMGGKGYDENPDDFPQSNYDMEKGHNEIKYNPSEAVDEYIEAFSYPGMTNLIYDEIKPDDEMISNQIKGNSKNGNAVTSKDGKALGNVSKRSEKTGDRFKKNFDENLYGAEQMNVSYKRQSQPVDVAGSKTQKGSLKGVKSNSTDKAEKILNQLESSEVKTTKIINEDLQKMKDLISYNRKTQ